jgi:hypothetical protein
MDDKRITKQEMEWSPADGRKKSGRPMENWEATMMEDMKRIEIDLKEAEQTAGVRMVWQSCVAKCAAGR